MDVSNDVYWRNGITRARWTSPPPYGLGSTGEHIHENMGTLNWEVTSFADGSSFEFIHTAGGLKGSLAFFKVEAENKSCRLQVQMKITGPILMRFMLIFMSKMMRKGVRGDLQMLKELMEKQN